jgi:hypothetical protein
MLNTVIIRKTKCILVLNMDEYKKFFKPAKKVWTEGAKHVTYECGELLFQVNEEWFNREVQAHVPVGILKKALQRGKYHSRLEKSYNTKGSGKHVYEVHSH